MFPEIFQATVAAGEQSGHLDAVLERLADYTESRQVTRNKINTALFYPIILVVLALGIVTMLLTYIVPQVVAVFDDLGQQLPLLTRSLIGLSEFLQAWGLILLAAVVAAVWLFRRALRIETNRMRFHRLLLRLPVLARLIRGLNAARFARTLSILAASGVPVLQALSIAAEVGSNRPMREAVRQAGPQVREGSSLNRALDRSGYFPPMVLHLIASGESSGSLDQMLERAAVHQEREMETRIGLILGMFEPAVILFMGLVVMIIVLAILLPIFELNQLVQ